MTINDAYSLKTVNHYIVTCIPGTGEPGGLPSMGSPRVGHDWSDLAADFKYYHVLAFGFEEVL